MTISVLRFSVTGVVSSLKKVLKLLIYKAATNTNKSEHILSKSAVFNNRNKAIYQGFFVG